MREGPRGRRASARVAGKTHSSAPESTRKERLLMRSNTEIVFLVLKSVPAAATTRHLLCSLLNHNRLRNTINQSIHSTGKGRGGGIILRVLVRKKKGEAFICPKHRKLVTVRERNKALKTSISGCRSTVFRLRQDNLAKTRGRKLPSS